MNHKPLIVVLFALALASSAVAERSYLAWGQRHDTTQDATQRGVAVAMDRRGNVFVTGYNDIAKDTWYTAKYDALTGRRIWEKTYSNGVGDDRPVALATDSAGNVIVTGFSTSANGRDYYTIKYSAVNGAELWGKRYNHPQNGGDETSEIVVDAQDCVIVTGKSDGTGTLDDIHTIKYDPVGTELWSRRYNSVGNFADKGRALALAPNRDVIVVGSSRVGTTDCYYVARLNQSNGTVAWDETYDHPSNDSDIATGAATNSAGEVFVTGTVRNANGIYSYHTKKYPAGGGVPAWSRTYSAPGGNGFDTPLIGVDPSGDVLISGTAVLDAFKSVFFTTKYNGTSGATMWEKFTDAPAGSPANTLVDDDVNSMAVDRVGNVIVAGTSDSAETGDDYLVVKYDNDGNLVWQSRINGDQANGNDFCNSVATNPSGSVAVTGTARKPGPSAFSQIITAKFNRLLLSVGEPVEGPGLTGAAVISALNVPSTADNGGIVTRVTVKDGEKLFGAILPQINSIGSTTVSALQGQPTPGVANGIFKSFNDPIAAPDGTYAFSGKISGVPAAQATGVWTNTFNGTLELAFQTGTQAPKLPVGVLIKSITNISICDGHVAALVSLKGLGVTGANSTALIMLFSPTDGYLLARTGQDAGGSTVKKLTIYQPPATSQGHGRYHGSWLGAIPRLVGLATFADKRQWALKLELGLGPLLRSDTSADNIVAGSMWKSFSQPCVSPDGLTFGLLGTLKSGPGSVGPKDDAVVVRSLGNGFTLIAREGSPSAGTPGTYVSFSDPVCTNDDRVAFLTKIKGSGISGANNSMLLFGEMGGLTLAARTGSNASDADGVEAPLLFTSLKSFAYPADPDSGPIFTAQVKGAGVNATNNLGLWGVDSSGVLRQLLRNGDVMGPHTVKKFTMLTPAAGALSASRSFNNTGGITALVSFTDKTQAIVYIGIP